MPFELDLPKRLKVRG